ncbi:protein of unknown function [Methylocella tundrae]|uniref:Integrase DNA-binding domain-containing protein n=1 Tax=Methylocella tundrae TaxID=227605 RepID=A0A4U8Z4T7_METTU|nr:protein of unknown function [Methylocella tundrae]
MGYGRCRLRASCAAISKTWIMAYRPAGAGRSANTKKLRLSTFPSVKTVEARRLAREIAGRIAAGEDPAVNRTELKRKKTSSVVALLDRYGDDLARRGYVNRVTVINGLEARLAPLKRAILRPCPAPICGQLSKRCKRSAKKAPLKTSDRAHARSLHGASRARRSTQILCSATAKSGRRGRTEFRSRNTAALFPTSSSPKSGRLQASALRSAGSSGF